MGMRAATRRPRYMRCRSIVEIACSVSRAVSRDKVSLEGSAIFSTGSSQPSVPLPPL